ncbi:MAG: DUF3237 family protein [Clostridia bacterium]|nr:DUF3237 family protein [Clostridia bacterium]
MKRIFTVHVHIRDTHTLKSELGQINMIVFDGYADAPFFKGEILSGACDTQKYLSGQPGTLSARYMLKGTDDEGKETTLFIENNARLNSDGRWQTVPWIMTDNPRLQWLSQLQMKGEIEGTDGGVLIHFYTEEKA